jgi:hypothetical protein
MLRKSGVFVGALIMYFGAFLLCSTLSRMFILFVNGASVVPETPFDYLAGFFSSAMAGWFGVLIAVSALDRWFASARVRPIAYSLIGLLLFLWLFGLLGVFTGNDPLPLFLFFSVELTIAIIATRSLAASKEVVI